MRAPSIEQPILEPPQAFLCPITQEIMQNPVIDEFGHSYEEAALKQWVANKPYSPLTRQEYQSLLFTPNYTLRELIAIYKNPNDQSQEKIVLAVSGLQRSIKELSVEVGELSQKRKRNRVSNGSKSLSHLWNAPNALNADQRYSLQASLNAACFSGDLLKMRQCVQDGAQYHLPDSQNIKPLSAAIWSLNIKAVKEILFAINPEESEIRECILFNEKTFGSLVPEFKLVNTITLNDFRDNYFGSGGREIIFSDWVAKKTATSFASWIKIKVGNEITAYTRRLGQFSFIPGNVSIIDIIQLNAKDTSKWAAFVNQYVLCEDAINEMKSFLNSQLSDAPLNISTYESTIRENVLGLDQLVFQEKVNKLLHHVARGEQYEAELMLKASPDLAKGSGCVTDPGRRKFLNITALQYAVWATDWHMWKMIMKYLPQEIIAKQLFEQAKITLTCGHGEHFDYTPLAEALRGYAENYGTWQANNPARLSKQWKGDVSLAQAGVVAHVANEYCRPDRKFHPTPNFTEEQLPRVLKKPDWNGDWWSAVYNNVHIGEDPSGENGWAIHRGWAEGGPGPWEGGPPTGCITHKTAVADYTAIVQLAKTRIKQRENLIRSFEHLAPDPEDEVHEGLSHSTPKM